MAYATLWAYPWDIVDDGVDRALDAIADAGLDAVSVASSYHTFFQIRPHRPGRKIFFAPESAIYFQPDLKLYEDTPIKPNVGPRARDSNLLRIISEGCDARNLGLISWTVCLHNTCLGLRYPEGTQRNVFGDPYPNALCPGNPAVRAYVRALCTDLTTNYNLRALELEMLNYTAFSPHSNHTKIGVRIGRMERFLMSLCFCHGCTARGRVRGIDVDGLKRTVAEPLQDALQHDRPSERGVDEFLSEHQELAAYLDMRREAVSSLIREIKEDIATDLHFIFMGAPRITGAEYRETASIVDKVEILCYTSSPDAVEARIRRMLPELDGPGRLVVGLSAYAPAAPDPETLEENVRRARRFDVGGLSFYNYGIMPMENLGWVKRALRAERIQRDQRIV